MTCNSSQVGSKAPSAAICSTQSTHSPPNRLLGHRLGKLLKTQVLSTRLRPVTGLEALGWGLGMPHLIRPPSNVDEKPHPRLLLQGRLHKADRPWQCPRGTSSQVRTDREQVRRSPGGRQPHMQLQGTSVLLCQGPAVCPLRRAHSLGQDNGHRVVEDALPENQHVEHRVHVERVENSDGGHWVHGRNQGAERKTVTKGTGRGGRNAPRSPGPHTDAVEPGAVSDMAQQHTRCSGRGNRSWRVFPSYDTGELTPRAEQGSAHARRGCRERPVCPLCALRLRGQRRRGDFGSRAWGSPAGRLEQLVGAHGGSEAAPSDPWALGLNPALPLASARAQPQPPLTCVTSKKCQEQQR